MSEAGALSIPPLLILGADDPPTPIAGGEDTARSIGGAELRIIPGMGHDIPECSRPSWSETIGDFVAKIEALEPGP